MNIKLQSTSIVSQEELQTAINENLDGKHKLKLAKSLAQYGTAYDMSFVEQILVAFAKICLLRIKKDTALYNRNRAYFNALKTIVRTKEAN